MKQLSRNQILQLPDDDLAALCTLEFFKGSGPGGQKRNKSSSAVRVTLREYDICAEDCTERSQHRNRANALNKLKLKLALAIRAPLGDDLLPLECATASPLYPLAVAQLLDLLQSVNWDYRMAAEHYGVTPSALLKKIFRDGTLAQEYNKLRQQAGLPPVSK